MIYGRGQIAIDTKEEYDYVACLWLEGNLNEEFIYLFNHIDQPFSQSQFLQKRVYLIQFKRNNA